MQGPGFFQSGYDSRGQVRDGGQGLGKSEKRVTFAVDKEDRSFDRQTILDPFHQPTAVGMVGIAFQAFHPGLHDNILAGNTHALGSVPEDRSQGACDLVAGQQEPRLPVRQIMDQMMPDPAALAHARSGNDHDPGHAVQFLGVSRILGEPDIGPLQHVGAAVAIPHHRHGHFLGQW